MCPSVCQISRESVLRDALHGENADFRPLRPFNTGSCRFAYPACKKQWCLGRQKCHCPFDFGHTPSCVDVLVSQWSDSSLLRDGVYSPGGRQSSPVPSAAPGWMLNDLNDQITRFGCLWFLNNLDFRGWVIGPERVTSSWGPAGFLSGVSFLKGWLLGWCNGFAPVALCNQGAPRRRAAGTEGQSLHRLGWYFSAFDGVGAYYLRP